MSATGRRGGATFGRLAALSAGLTAGLLGISALPVLLEAQRSLDLSATTMGMIATTNALAAAAGALTYTARFGRLRPATLAGWCLVAIAAGYVACAAAPSVVVLMAGGGLAGAASGVIFAVSGAAIATMPDPERAAGWAMAGNTLPTAGIIALLGVISNTDGVRAAYLFFGLIHLALLPLMAALPGTGAPSRRTGFAGRETWGRPVVALLVGVIVFSASETGLYAYAGDIAVHRTGMTEAEAGFVLAIATIAGLAGAFAAAVAGTRYGSVLPVVLVLGIGFVCKVLICLLIDPAAYTTLQLVWGASFPAAQAYLIGTAGRLDRTGRSAAAATAALVFGGAVGPMQMGVAIDAGGYPLASVITIGLAVATIAACAWAAARADAGMDDVTTDMIRSG